MREPEVRQIIILTDNMAKIDTIAVVYGSDSSEWEVACRSGEFTASRIDEGCCLSLIHI